MRVTIWRRARRVSLFCAMATVFLMAQQVSAQQQQRRGGNWDIECKISRMTDKSVCTIGLRLSKQTPPVGEYALLVTGPSVSIVGHPPLAFATLRIDRYQARTCRGPTFCNFSGTDSVAILRELNSGSQALLEIVSGGPVFDFTEEIGGYRLAAQKQREWGYTR